jgi:excisionase family DNA binding protein
MSTPKLLTVKQVAQTFGVSERSVRRWEADGSLRSVRIADTVRFSESALRDFVTAHEQKRDREMDAEMVTR